MIVTGAGLTILGATTIADSLPILSGTLNSSAIDNEYDQQPVSPWAVVDVDPYLKTIEQ